MENVIHKMISRGKVSPKSKASAQFFTSPDRRILNKDGSVERIDQILDRNASKSGLIKSVQKSPMKVYNPMMSKEKLPLVNDYNVYVGS